MVVKTRRRARIEEELAKSEGESSKSSLYDSASDSDSASGSDSESSTDLDDDKLDALFQKSLNAIKKREGTTKTDQDEFEDNENIIQLENDDKISNKEIKSNLNSSKQKRAKGVNEKELEKAFEDLKSGQNVQKEKSLRKLAKERKIQNSKTAGKGWDFMPAVPESTKGIEKESLLKPKDYSKNGKSKSNEEIRQEVQAIRLRNSIDPKRFYKESLMKNLNEIPKFAQIGKIIESKISPFQSMSKSERGKTALEELIKDSEITSFAKRKFNEQQNLKNVGWSSHVRRGNNNKRHKK